MFVSFGCASEVKPPFLGRKGCFCCFGRPYVVAQTVYGNLGRQWDTTSRYCKNCGHNLTGNMSGACPECGMACECTTCGYNLTGNVSGVCPECGTRVPGAGSDGKGPVA